MAELSESTFVETFANDNRPEDMDLYVEQTFGVEKQLSEILDPKRRIAIAWVRNVAAGFYHLFEGVPDASVTGPRPIEILRLYVDSRFHGKGIGPALMEACIAKARSENYQTLWLGVWERNLRAQAFYKKHSFIAVGKHRFTLGTNDQLDLIMSRQI